MHYGSGERGQALIKLSGRFDFSAFKSFRDMYEPLLTNGDVENIDVNFDAVDYLDSAALGMLLMLREKAETVGKQVQLSGCRGNVLQLLEIANFGRMFEMS
jgi:anti-anti-sigma factor